MAEGLKFSHDNNLRKLKNTGASPMLTPWVMVGRIFVGDH